MTDQLSGLTKTVILERVRTAIRSVRVGTVIEPGHADFPFLRAVFDRHPERARKYGPGLAGFRVIVNPYGHRAVNIVRVDGSDMEVSFVTAARGTADSVEKNLRAAMRTAIAGQVATFREEHRAPDAPCGVCAAPVGPGMVHVDHHAPTFEELVVQFLEAHPAHPREFIDSTHDNSAKFAEADAEFEAAWSAFHAERARLRITHPKCNLTRKRKGAQSGRDGVSP